MKELEQIVAVVTGGTRGIGLGIAKELARQGATVVMVYAHDDAQAERAAGEVNELVEGEQPAAKCWKADVTSLTQLELMLSGVHSVHGRVDAVVHAVGASHWDPVAELDPALFDRVLARILYGAYFLTKLSVPVMRGQHFGRLVYVASGAVTEPRAYPNMAAEAIAKLGLVALAKAVAVEEAESGITANVVATSFAVPEEASEEERRQLSSAVPMGRGVDPLEVGRTVAFLVSPKSAYITGQVVGVTGGFNL